MTEVIHMERRGRKALPDDQKAKFKVVSLRVDVVKELNAMADRLVPELGFRPTVTQTIAYMLRKTAP